MVRTRIAPSPTGYLHIGTARTSLFNYLFAKKQGGAFVVRIEDTDLERGDKAFEADIFESLEWLGIKADESPAVGGPYAPYRQSERIPTYRKFIEHLLTEGKAFYCFHSEKELKDEKKEQMGNKLPLRHVCLKWRNYSRKEAEKKLEQGENAIIRLKTPHDKKDIVFDDIIHHHVHFFTSLLGDFSIAKSLDVPLYNFAVVIDDHEMQITHVIRGEDHIPNTPKQLLIAEALGWAKKDAIGVLQAPWKYTHLPLILGPDRAKLSKRHGATAIREFREQGYLPEAIVNFMALLGWNPGGDRELFTLEELANAFSLKHVQLSSAVFDIEKLNWMNGEYIRGKPLQELVPIAMAFLSGFSVSDTERALILEQSRIQKLSDLYEHVRYLKEEPDYPTELLSWKQMTDADVRRALERSRELIADLSEKDFIPEALEAKFLAAIGAGDKGEWLWPLRVALTGLTASPGPFEIMAELGRPKTLERIGAALQKLDRTGYDRGE